MIDKFYFLIAAISASAGAYALWGKNGHSVFIIARRFLMCVAAVSLFGMMNSEFSVGMLLVASTVLLFFVVAPALLIVNWFYNKFGGIDDDKEHRRGAKIADTKSVQRMLKNEESRFDFGGVPVPIELETRSFLLAGAPGTGKSQALTRALDALREYESQAIIADASGVYLSRYFDESRGDVIINPFDQRSVRWSPIAELEGVEDIPALCKSLIPDADGEGRIWTNYAQAALDAILEHVYKTHGTNGDIFEFAVVTSTEHLRVVFAGTPAAALVAEGNEKMFASVRGTMTDALSVLRYLPADAGAGDFSIREHIASSKTGWIFLSYQQQHRAALSKMLSACIDVAARAVLSLPPSLDRRVVFTLDELPLLGKIQSVVDLLTNGRKHGAVVFAGLQTVSQLRENYGRDTAQTLLACLGSWLVLRVSDSETAEYMSKYLGDEEKTRTVRSGGQSSKSMDYGKTESDNWSEQVVKDRIVMPSELQNLRDMFGFFNLAGPVPVARIELELARQTKSQAESFVKVAALKAEQFLRTDAEQSATDTASNFPPGFFDAVEETTESKSFEV